MADTKLTGLTSLTSATTTDIFYVVDDPAGTPLSKKITLDKILDSTLLKNGSRALTADWDVGSFKVTAEQFESDIVTGTAPIIVASTTVVGNLNADQVDGKDSTDLLLVDGTQAMAGTLNMGTNAISSITTLSMAGDLTDYEAVNDANPQIRIGSSDAEELHIQAIYDAVAQTLSHVLFQTDAASVSANKGLFRFNVDGTNILDIDDGGIDLDTGMALSVNGTDVLNATTLGSTVLASSLTSVGTLSALTMGGNIVMADNSLTGIDTLAFTDVLGTIAGIQNQNLVDKSSPETIAGSWTLSVIASISMTGNIVMADNSITGINILTFNDVAGTIAGIQNQNLVDKSATETIAGTWTLSNIAALTMSGNIVMADNSVTGVDTITFTDVLGTIAGIQNQNLVDKSAAETIAGSWTLSVVASIAMTGNIVMADNSVTGVDTITFTDTAGTIGGIQNGNLVDKAATETISGDWTHTGVLGITEQDHDTTPAADHSANGPTTSDLNAGFTVVAMDLVYLGSAGKWLEADASAVGTAGTVMLAIALEAGTDTNPLKVALPGSYVRDDTWIWTPGATLYVSETAGAITATAPTTADAVVRVVGFALTADIVYFFPSSDHITVTG